jgi:hypothetical protein
MPVTWQAFIAAPVPELGIALAAGADAEASGLTEALPASLSIEELQPVSPVTNSDAPSTHAVDCLLLFSVTPRSAGRSPRGLLQSQPNDE